MRVGALTGTSRRRDWRRATPGGVVGLFLLALVAACGLFAALAPADAAATLPGVPKALTPSGAGAQTRPTFTWSKAKDAVTYEVRVYQGTAQLVKAKGISGRSWTSPRTLPRNVALVWKVRAANAEGTGDWSAGRTFTVGRSEKKITSFRFSELEPVVKGMINQGLRKIRLTVPHGTSIKRLVASFKTTGVKVTVNGVRQESGVTINDFSKPVTYTVKAGDGSKRDYTVSVSVAPNKSLKDITSFSFEELNPTAVGVIDEKNLRITVPVPAGTDVTNLIATFTTTGVRVTLNNVLQVSGQTPNDFTYERWYTVTAQDGSHKSYQVDVVVDTDTSPRRITEFGFPGLTPPGVGVIDQSKGTIAVSVPAGTDVTALAPTVVYEGASLTVGGIPQVSGVTANDFTTPVTYRVTSASGKTMDYVVTVSVAADTSTQITAFQFASLDPPAVGQINHVVGTIAVSVPAGTDVTALVATFATSGASVTVRGVEQESGTTPNDFTKSVTYTVTSATGTTKDYLVSVTVGTPLSSEKVITSFRLKGISPQTTELDQEALTITVHVSVDLIDGLSGLVAIFTTTGVKVEVEGDEQTSGVTANDFSSFLVYTVTAEDGSSADYLVFVSPDIFEE